MRRRRISDPFVVVVRCAGFQIVPATIWLTTVVDTLYWTASAFWSVPAAARSRIVSAFSWVFAARVRGLRPVQPVDDREELRLKVFVQAKVS